MKLSNFSKQNKQNKNKNFKGEKTMKNTKLKVLVITLAVCLLAMGSLGTLAWFTAEDEVTNNFLIADSEDDADEIFSIDVWEDKTSEDTSDEEKIQDGIKFEDLQPGDDLYKEVNIENTGYYAQYVRATVTVTGATTWQKLYGKIYWNLTELATDVNADFTLSRVVYNADKDTMTYVYYYNNELEAGDFVTLFTDVKIPTAMTQYDAAELSGEFDINVKAEAVQTANVGDNAIAAFTTVGMYEDGGEYTVVDTAKGLERILNNKELWDRATLNDELELGDSLTNAAGNNAVLDLKEGEIVLETTYVQNEGVMEVNDGTIVAGTPSDYSNITKGAGAETTYNDVEIKSAGGGVAASAGAKVVYNSGEIYVSTKSTSGRYIFYAEGAGSEIVINGGNFSWAASDNQKRAYVYAGAGTTVIINGGTFGKASTRSDYKAGILGSGTVVIKGGTFGFDPTAWVDTANYDVVYDSTDKTWTVNAK